MLGWPVAHSRSPAIQNAALRAAGLGHWRYQLLPVPPEVFAETVTALAAAGLRGANVTIPHKQAALALAAEATASARSIGAANTLLFDDAGAIHADNTDAPALIEALPFAMRGATALVLGAGGSARAAVWALLAAGASEVRVWNRTPERALRLCAQLGGTPASAAAAADLLVHCTAVGLDGSDDPFAQLPIGPEDLAGFGCVVDFVYRGELETALVRAARERSIPTVDGLELLIGQGALSFERFTAARYARAPRAIALDSQAAACKFVRSGGDFACPRTSMCPTTPSVLRPGSSIRSPALNEPGCPLGSAPAMVQAHERRAQRVGRRASCLPAVPRHRSRAFRAWRAGARARLSVVLGHGRVHPRARRPAIAG